MLKHGYNGPTDNEPAQQCPVDIITSSVHDPDVMQAPPNQAAYPVEGGDFKSLSGWFGTTTAGSGSTSKNTTSEGRPGEESGGHRSHKRRAIRNGTNGEDTRPSSRNATTSAYSPFQSPGGGTGGGKTSIPATLWEERGSARYGPK
ncbi:hypothetical protein NDU88_001577 [Pleurodeles waltl]|uniref:Uncharacterized protein n=1 Tax=Pleurodeles waltl TaxID=8319 RepID=A0AAV7TJ91_PLEWA|nr:hypothetical protein NDU88_001577 [Pleurodeles waltl]